MEKPIGVAIVQGHLRNNSIATSALAHDRHIIRVTTESSDIGFHPLQSETLIEEACVARWERLVSHESQGSKTVADIDGDEVLALADPVAEVVVCCSAVL